ncbi:hypothetical protein HY339_03130 [Candidatus Gottesmanbacteria bacterium]|nr:hypothetical protein [Candidatus Gottesmanbacteria bacterium]
MTLALSAFLLTSELCLLSLLSRKLTQSLYVLFFRIFRNKTVSMTILVILLFPGTVVHELAHLFVAEVLRVRTGKLTLVPEGLEDTEIKAGGVMIAQTDPLRRTLIGLAPVYVGIAVLAALSYFLSQNITVINVIPIIIFYIIFAVSNSMFSSKEDMKGVIPFAITVGLFAAAAYFAGFRVGLTGELLEKILSLIQTLVRSLGIVLAVNLIGLILASMLLGVIQKR